MIACVSRPPPPPTCFRRHSNFTFVSSSTVLSPIAWRGVASFRVRAVRIGSDGGRTGSSESCGSNLLKKPTEPLKKETGGISEVEEVGHGNGDYRRREAEEEMDWEDQILEDTVPLVSFVRMILHSGKYENGDRLSPQHETAIVDRLLPYHPEFEKKIGCGIDYITVGNHPDYEGSRCMFIVRKDGQLVDFSYWKCIKGLIRQNYPIYADSFILRHFRKRRQNR